MPLLSSALQLQLSSFIIIIVLLLICYRIELATKIHIPSPNTNMRDNVPEGDFTVSYADIEGMVADMDSDTINNIPWRATDVDSQRLSSGSI